MTDFVARTLRCPVCNAGFAAEVPVGVHPSHLETDFRPVFDGPDPLCAGIFACPNCRYAGYARAFELTEPDEEDEEELVGADLPPPVDPLGMPEEEDLDDLRRWIRRGELVEGTGLEARDPTPAERFLLAARCRDFLTEDNPLPIADLYLRGGWCARAAGDRALERRLLGEAIELFEAALDEGVVAPQDRARTIYLVAELARRIGDFGTAVDYFHQVDAHLELEEPESVRLHRLARRMEALASVQSDVPARMPSDEDLDAAGSMEELAWLEADEDEEEEEEEDE